MDGYWGRMRDGLVIIAACAGLIACTPDDTSKPAHLSAAALRRLAACARRHGDRARPACPSRQPPACGRHHRRVEMDEGSSLRTVPAPRNCTETGSFIHFNTPVVTAGMLGVVEMDRPAGSHRHAGGRRRPGVGRRQKMGRFAVSSGVQDDEPRAGRDDRKTVGICPQ